MIVSFQVVEWREQTSLIRLQCCNFSFPTCLSKYCKVNSTHRYSISFLFVILKDVIECDVSVMRL